MKAMTVADLIQQLQSCPPEHYVVFPLFQNGNFNLSTIEKVEMPKAPFRVSNLAQTTEFIFTKNIVIIR